jgi:two-component system, OmpR family, sensor histidine kinase MprB
VTFRLRLALAAGLAVAATVAIASGVVYLVMRSELRSNVDEQLRQRWTQIQQSGPEQLNRMFNQHFGEPFSVPRSGPSTTANYIQLVQADGETVLGRGESAKVPVDQTTLSVAAGKQRTYFANATVGGKRSRVFTVHAGANAVTGLGIALQFVRPVDDIERTLGRLRLILLLVVAGGLAAGAAAGALVSRSALVPVRRLTAAAERITRTGDPSERVPAVGRDELGRLGASFNTMLAKLDEVLETQRRFVADASHELRTPLTSLQTNIDVLRRQEAQLEPAARERLLTDLQRESHEMRSLIGGLLELARGEDPRLERTTVQLDELVGDVLERARSRFPQVTWEAELHPTRIEGYPERLERAVWNLLENAGKWSGEGSRVEVTLSGGELRVRDHGPGIAPEDRPLVFDRFYRSVAARSMPGSGLGLAIVREVAEAHGGRVSAEEAPGGGALMRLSLNGSQAPAAAPTNR